MQRSPRQIMAILEKLDELKVEKIAPCHCSGDTARELFSQHYEENYITCGVGLVLEIPGDTLDDFVQELHLHLFQ